MVFLAMFQFTLPGFAGAKSIAAITFIAFFGGLLAVATYACYCRLRFGHYESKPDRLNFKRKMVWRVPWFVALRESQRTEKDADTTFNSSMPWWRIHFIDDDPERTPVHEDEDYISKFGWLAARFRRTRWWFFAAWLVYELVRACFYAGAQADPRAQVFGLLVIEIIALIAIINCKPFESSRLNTLMVYLLGFSKVATLALSVAFDVRYNLSRITTTAIGIVIIVIQGILTIILLIAIVIGAISSYFSVIRNRDEIVPASWLPLRERYFKHLDKATADLPPPPPPEPEQPIEPYFSVNSIKRVPKIADEDLEVITDLADRTGSRVSVRRSRANSVSSASAISHTTVPFGGYVHRASWNTSQIWSTEDTRNPDASRTSGSRSSTAPLVLVGPGPATMSSVRDFRDYQQPICPAPAVTKSSPLSQGSIRREQQRGAGSLD
jgi:Transient receptor potential (TRP) ion channel